MKSLPPWSHSMLEKFDQCPRAAYHRYILKEKEPETEALRHGNAVHKAMEERIKGAPLPECYARYSPMAESIVNAYKKGMKIYAELKMGLTKEFKPCGFFDKDVWGRSAADVVLKHENKIIVFDWKTGKKKEKETQLQILALFLFKHFPQVDKIVGCNLWLEPGDIGTPYTFARGETAPMWKNLLVRIQAMEKAFASNTWPEMPSGLCLYCPVKACNFNRS